MKELAESLEAISGSHNVDVFFDEDEGNMSHPHESWNWFGSKVALFCPVTGIMGGRGG